jgi:hypothetical protein
MCLRPVVAGLRSTGAGQGRAWVAYYRGKCAGGASRRPCLILRLPGPVGEVVAGLQGFRVLSAQHPLLDGQQRGVLNATTASSTASSSSSSGASTAAASPLRSSASPGHRCSSSRMGMGSGAQHAISRSRPTACGAECSSRVSASDQVVATVWLYPVGSPRASRRAQRCRNDATYLARLPPLALM